MSNKTIQAVIFDLDGTLLDSIDDLADSANLLLERNGLPPYAASQYHDFVGNGLMTLIRRMFPEGSSEEAIRSYAREFRTIYQSRWNNKTRPYDGVIEMLEKLEERGIITAILSNKPEPFTIKCVSAFFPDAFFKKVRGQRDGVPVKPDPQEALAIAAGIGVEPGSCLFVGDSNVDMQTGVSSGMLPVGVSWGYRTVQELQQSGAKLIINTPAELIDYVTRFS